MAGATFGVGLIPSYDHIGFWAPTLLILLRMVQGFSTGGEYGGAATFLAEYAPDDRPGFFGSFLAFGSPARLPLGAALVLLFSLTLGRSVLPPWGWANPFLDPRHGGVVGP